MSKAFTKVLITVITFTLAIGIPLLLFATQTTASNNSEETNESYYFGQINPSVFNPSIRSDGVDEIELLKIFFTQIARYDYDDNFTVKYYNENNLYTFEVYFKNKIQQIYKYSCI